MGLLRRHVARVTVEGLDIEIPPDHGQDVEMPGGLGQTSAPFVIDELVSLNAKLAIIPRERDAPQRVWAIHRLRSHIPHRTWQAALGAAPRMARDGGMH